MNTESKYKGIIIEESLDKPDLIKSLEVVSSGVSENLVWHLHTVLVSESDIKQISSILKPDKYYAHFWKEDDIIVVFRDKIFKIKHSNKFTWKDVIEYGKSLNIPEEQLDFPITKS